MDYEAQENFVSHAAKHLSVLDKVLFDIGCCERLQRFILGRRPNLSAPEKQWLDLCREGISFCKAAIESVDSAIVPKESAESHMRLLLSQLGTEDEEVYPCAVSLDAVQENLGFAVIAALATLTDNQNASPVAASNAVIDAIGYAEESGEYGVSGEQALSELLTEECEEQKRELIRLGAGNR